MARFLSFVLLIVAFAGQAALAQVQVPSLPDSNGPVLSAPATSASTALPFEVQATSSTPVQAPVEAHSELPVGGATPESASTEPFAETVPDQAPSTELEALTQQAEGAVKGAMTFLADGGPSIWAIAALAVITLALILWKTWRLALMGAWSKGKAWRAVHSFERGAIDDAVKTVHRRRGVRSKVVAAGLMALHELPEDKAREEVGRIAKGQLARARSGLGALELISTIAPLLGLLGTVLGMIAAFQALQAAGSKADPALLAGGIWEALLTTAAGMAVAIPASAALTWFESVIDSIRRDLEDAASRLFIAVETEPSIRLAAE